MANIFQPSLFRGKRAFVSGGSSGINLEIAQRLVGLGADVAIFSRSQEKIDAALALLRAGGGSAAGYTGDVRQYETVAAAIEDFAQAGDGIDFVISGAAGNFVAPAAQMSPNAFRTVVDIDLMGTYHVLRASFAHLRRPGASLINISAVQSSQAIPFQAHVCSAKAGIDMLTKALAVEWGPAGIRVNAILPGPIEDTEGMRRLSSTPELADRIARGIPLQRYGTKAEVANLAAFLCSDAASYISGAIMACDGGQLAGNPQASSAESGKPTIPKDQQDIAMSTSPLANDLSAYWLPFTANKSFKAAPRLITGAKGQYYTTADGRAVRDGFSGLWCSILGHSHPKVTEAIIRQAQTLDYSPAFNFATPAAFELASRVAEQFPAGLEHLFFTNSGSEAVDTALKMSLAYHRARGEGARTRFIGRVNGYHGVGFGGISVGGMANNRKFFGPGLPGVDHLPFPYDAAADAFTRGEPRSDPMAYLKELEAIIALHDASTIAAVIVEPMIGSAGVFIPPAGYLHKLREITARHGILLILDEVITGFGRLGAANGASFFGVTPDLCTMAKGINNAAVPMGAVIASRQIYDTILNATPSGVEFFHGYTYSAHPLAVAAGLATQHAIREEGLYANVARLSPLFEEMLHSLRGEPYVIDIRNIGLAGGLTLAPYPDGPGLRGFELFLKAYERGVAIRSNGDTIAIAPILNSNEDDLGQIIDIVRLSLRALG